MIGRSGKVNKLAIFSVIIFVLAVLVNVVVGVDPVKAEKPDKPPGQAKKDGDNGNNYPETIYLIDIDSSLRKHLEGRIGWNLRESHPQHKIFYPDDCHIGGKHPTFNNQIKISIDGKILGLDEVIPI